MLLRISKIGIIHRVVPFPILNRMNCFATHTGVLKQGVVEASTPPVLVERGRGQECPFHQMAYFKKDR